jgi:hypothetical protein
MVTKRERSALHRTCNVVGSIPLSQLHFSFNRRTKHRLSSMVLFSLLHSQWRECCPGESPLLHIAFVRIGGASFCSRRQTLSNLRFPSLLPNLSDLHCDCLLREALHAYRVPSLVRPFASSVVVVVVFPRGRGGFSAIRESFNVQIIMMLYIVIHSCWEALHGLHEPVFSFVRVGWYIHVPTHSTLDPFYNTYL